MSDQMTTDRIERFKPHATDEDLAALRARLASTRLPERATTPHDARGRDRWEQGPPLADIVELLEYWRTTYDWRPFERRLNEIGQFRTVVDGLGIHFLHRRSPRPDAIPLVLTHGWPGSVAEFVDIIDELAEPQDAETPTFHVVVPSLPGYGFSDKPAEEGWGTERIAAAWVQLMGRLGYDRFLAHGGDWGGPVTIALGGRFPAHVIGIHTTMPIAPPGLGLDGLDDTERQWVEHIRAFERNRLAYARVMATAPQTIGYSLVDSPVGLLAWILEKFFEWSDTVDSPFETISRDRFLDNVTLYWLTATGASAARISLESHQTLDPDLRVTAPAALTTYPHDIEKHPRPWAEERFRQIVRWRAPEAGGHFPALERPGEFVRDLREGLVAVLAASALRRSPTWRDIQGDEVNELNELGVLGDDVFMSPHERPSRQTQVVEPPQDLDEMMQLANFLEHHSAPAVLLGPDGEQVPLPLAAYEALKRVVAAMERGASVSLEPIDRQLTTQQAATLLGISRNTLVRLLDEHELPFERLGESRHRRLRLHDVLAYRDRKREERRSRLDEMTRQAHDDGLYDADASDYAEALRRAREQ